MISIVGKDTTTWVQFLDKAVYISQSANMLEKSMYLDILLPTMSK